MTDLGKITIASALSVLVHVTLFTVLALWPAPALPLGQPQIEEPQLEMTLQAAAYPKPPFNSAPEVTSTQPVQPELPSLSPVQNAIRTQLDPEHLKEADQAPENPTAIAAHNSRVTPNPQESLPQPSPNSTPEPDSSTLALQPSETPAKSSEEEVGIDALGNYGKAVGNAIGVRFERYRKMEKNALSVGEVKIKFAIDGEGRISEVEVISNSADARNAALAERAIKEAQIPPIPSERLAQVPGGRIKIVYTFTTY